MKKKIKTLVGRLHREEEGATLVEYVLLVALIGVAAVTGVTVIGGKAQNSLSASSNTIP